MTNDHEHAGGAPDLLPLRAVEPAPRHPFDPLTGAEIDRARDILAETVRVPMMLPDEYDHAEIAAWSPGDEIDRRVDVTPLGAATGDVTEAIVSLTRGEVVSQRAPRQRSPVRAAQVPFRGVRA